jgi:hypothetical protein
MADKKDDKDKPAGKTGEEVFVIGLMLFLGVMLFMRAVAFFSPTDIGNGVSSSPFEMFTGGPNGWYANFLHYVNVTVSVYVTIATIFSLVTFLAIIYVYWRIHELGVEEVKKDKMIVAAEDLPSMQSQKWQKVLTHANSQNPAEWRLSILEADVMLDEMMQSIGLHGDSVGERLKNTSKADFKTIDTAWEAHKIRNAIAHEGSDFLLSQRESKRIVGLYEIVFKEFKYI